MSEAIITVDNLGKRYQLGASKGKNNGGAYRYKTFAETLVQGAKSLLRPRSNPITDNRTTDNSKTPQEFWALKDVSFEVKCGEVVGIIGRNGAGKSTLLKILSRITEPTKGRVHLKGRVASLLEVGTGFHPELTGRENIFLNGAILGMSRAEMLSKFDEIVEFAEVEKFLDTPVKRYSSGMYVRLAFAVAAHIEPEILVVDEVLAVGDAEFQKKCLGKMHDVAAKEGRTVLFVSHQMNAVEELCTQCFLLRGGALQAAGTPADIISTYLRNDATASIWTAEPDKPSPYYNPYFSPARLAIVDENLTPVTRAVRGNERVGVLIEGVTEISDSALTVGFALFTSSGVLLFWSYHTDIEEQKWPQITKGHNRLLTWLPQHLLNEGDYRLELMVSLHYRSWLIQPGVNSPAIHLRVQGGLSDSPIWNEARPGLLAPILPFERI
ncbi:MAG TPA: polysaccharide ABC transporter ATP-binding protein [Chryseolinea sp.]